MHSCVRYFAVAVWLVAVAAPAGAAPEQDTVGSARAAATSGRRTEALAMLSAFLAAEPNDVDARLLYGLVLSWDGRYDEARAQLDRVLAQAPGYTEAQVALMNVDWWSGDAQAARERAASILGSQPSQPDARRVRDILDAGTQPWQAGVSYAADSFNDGRAPWAETVVALTRRTARGSVIVKASEARRFGLVDRMGEVEAYPSIRPGTYAFVGFGAAPGGPLFPSYRFAFDLYQSLGRGVEVSGGMRRLAFDKTTSIFVSTASKYVGNWMLTGKVFHVPAPGDLDSTSYHAGVRRYVRHDGDSYLGVTYSHGFSKEEITNAADLKTLGSNTIRLDVYQRVAGRLRLSAGLGTSRQGRQNQLPSWQTSLTTGTTVVF